MRYKACCNSVCLIGNCKTRDAGGCYCVCRLKDYEDTLLSVLEGSSFWEGGGFIYEPARCRPPEGEEKEKTLAELQKVREKLKDYEINAGDVKDE